MMRGADTWAVAVRRPDGSIHCESHTIDSIARRWPILRKPGLRGVIALGQALVIGVRALTISANHSVEDEEKLTGRQMAISMAVAFAFFIGIFIVGPAVLFRFAQDQVRSSFLLNAAEGVFRVLLFLAYLLLIGRMRDIRRVFQYHGAEHKTIAAYEHAAPLEPRAVDRYSTLHVRCGTNFLLIVMILTIFVFAIFGTPSLGWRVGSRIVAIPLIAGLAFEALRLGAKYPGSRLMRGLMTPGLWLQKITTKPPTEDQIEIAIASFEEVRRREQESAATGDGQAAAEGPLPMPADRPEAPHEPGDR
jgi:uncharacterized protein YqhQ